jgi:hypothetical protein
MRYTSPNTITHTRELNGGNGKAVQLVRPLVASLGASLEYQ